jgi:hypothetical protein
MAQCGIVDTAAAEALNGDGTSQVLVEMFEECGLLQHSEEGKCFVTGEVVIYANGILKLLGYGAHACVDAASITNSWTHLVMSDPKLVRLGVEIELELHVGSTPYDVSATPSTRLRHVRFAGQVSLTDHLLVLQVRAHRPGGDG